MKRDVNTWRNVGLSLPQATRARSIIAAVRRARSPAYRASERAARVAAVQDQPGDALRMPERVVDAGRRALRDAEQRHRPVGSRGVDDRAEVRGPLIERQRAARRQSLMPQPRSS